MMSILFVAVIWIMLVAGLLRAWRRGQLSEPSAWAMWGVFTSMALAFVFRVTVVQDELDRHFDDLPLAYSIKIAFVLIAAGLYWRVLGHVQPLARRSQRWLTYLVPLALLGNTLVLFMGKQGRLSHQQVYYSMMGISDLTVCLFMVFMFVPINWYLMGREHSKPLRLKYAATLVFCVSYSLTTSLSIIFAPLAVLTGKVSPLLEGIPLAPIVFVCIVIQLLPNKYMQKVFYFERLYLLFKLRHLEQTVMGLSGRVSQLPQRINLLNEASVEAAIYAALIGILDYSWEAAKDSTIGQEIYRQVMGAAQRDADYDMLVHAIAKVKA